MNPRLTIDYGLRLQHSGSYFEVNEMNSGFFTDQWNQFAGGARLPVGLHGWPSRQSGLCGEPAADDRSREPRHVLPGCVQRHHRAGQRQPDQRRQHRGHRGQESRHLLHVPVSQDCATRRVCLERVRRREDGAARARGASSTTSRDRPAAATPTAAAPAPAAMPFSGGCPISCQRQIRWATFDDISERHAEQSGRELRRT